jgi:hypothetical protein
LHHRAGLHCVADEGQQTAGGDVGNAPQSNAADAVAFLLRGHHHDGLGRGLPAADARLRAAHVGLIDLDLAAETISTGTDHGATKLVEPDPGGLVAAQPQDPLEA